MTFEHFKKEAEIYFNKIQLCGPFDISNYDIINKFCKENNYPHRLHIVPSHTNMKAILVDETCEYASFRVK